MVNQFFNKLIHLFRKDTFKGGNWTPRTSYTLVLTAPHYLLIGSAAMTSRSFERVSSLMTQE